MVNEGLMPCGGNWASQGPLFLRKTTGFDVDCPNFPAETDPARCRARFQKLPSGPNSTRICRDLGTLMSTTCSITVWRGRLAGRQTSPSHTRAGNVARGWAMESSGAAAVAGHVPDLKTTSFGRCRHRPRLFDSTFLLAVFRSIRTSTGRARARLAVENFIYPLDERVRVTRQRSSV